MKKPIIVLSACAAVLVAPHALAQSANFRGLSAGIGLNFADSKNDFSLNGYPSNGSDPDNNLVLQLQYNAALSEKVLLGLGGTIGMGDLKAGSVNNWPYNEHVKLKDSYSLYVAPGYAFNNNWLGYGKIAYLNGKLKGERFIDSVDYNDGYGYGLGVQMLFNKHWFGQAEYMHNEFGERSESNGLLTAKLKLHTEVISLGVGYKF